MPEKPDLFKGIVWDALIKLALQQLFKAIPFLGWGPIGWIVTWIIGHFMDKLYEGLKEHIDLQGIAIRNEELRLKYDVASIRLHSLAVEQGENSDAYKAELEKENSAFLDAISLRAS